MTSPRRSPSSSARRASIRATSPRSGRPSFRGLASYTVPKIDVLVSASMRSLETTPGGGVATNGLSLAANYVVPNTIIAQSLGRLPANALATGTTTVNLLNPGSSTRWSASNLVDMRFAKILRFGGRRTDVGIDLYNLFNSNVTTGVSADLRAANQRRGVADADRHRGAAARAVPRDVQLLDVTRMR